MSRSGKRYIGTSWKMTKTLDESRAFAADLVAALPSVPDGVQPFILPSHTSLAAVRNVLGPDSPIMLGAQNAHWARPGAHTGEVSMEQVRDAGATLVEIGHSERRAAFGETDEAVMLKSRRALDLGMMALICVGESSTTRALGGQVDFVVGQVAQALAAIRPDELDRVIIAYEPLWAIGESGQASTPGEVGDILTAIRDRWRGLEAVIYGGSVNIGNANGYLALPALDGLFVGRAAWSVGQYLKLLQLATPERQRRTEASPA